MPKLSFRKGTPAYAKRRQIAEAIARENPGIDMGTKFREATAATKKEMSKRIRRGK